MVGTYELILHVEYANYPSVSAQSDILEVVV